MDETPALEIKGISKTFANIHANDKIDLTLEQGEIHALLGENGAGKSTLMNIISGLYQPDEGSILLNGKPVKIQTPHDAINLGIGMIHQHFMLIPGFTVLENIILGKETKRGPFLDLGKAKQDILNLSKGYGLSVDPDAVVENLSVGLQQRVEIIKALFRKSKILILDEPTAVLTPGEAQDLFNVMHLLTKKGVSIFFITHKLKEVMAVADRITVLRNGTIKGTVQPDDTDIKSLADLMVGRDVSLKIHKSASAKGKKVFGAGDLTILDNRDIRAVKEVTFDVHEGEILGIAGVQGNGQTELAEAITGLRSIKEGGITLSGNPMPEMNPRIMMENGLAHIPEDRLKHGLILSYPLFENQVLCTYYKPPFARGILRNHTAVQKNSYDLIEKFNVKAKGPDAIAQTLSGGNQQKVIISRELSRDATFLLANQPTRGLDVGSIEYIHQTIMNMRDKGVGILLISSELDEILSLSDTILVMFEGKIVERLNALDTTKEELGILMSGAKT